MQIYRHRYVIWIDRFKKSNKYWANNYFRAFHYQNNEKIPF